MESEVHELSRKLEEWEQFVCFLLLSHDPLCIAVACPPYEVEIVRDEHLEMHPNIFSCRHGDYLHN